MYALKLQSLHLLQRYPDGKRANPTQKSDIAKDKTNQLPDECSRRVLAMRKITKPFPTAVVTERNQPKKFSHHSI